ncbi:hypothetical protein [Prosthecobacter sp.]|uniref:hypothetical protein n=1 Tax=Prosthecobacter sp. TaxID=1965333 RepID=UPI003782F36F
MVGIITGLLISAYYALQVWKMLFPKEQPPAHELYATKAEMLKLEEEHEEEMKRIEHRFEQWLEQQSQQHQESMQELRAWRSELSKWQMGIENVVGKIDTKADLALKQRGSK